MKAEMTDVSRDIKELEKMFMELLRSQDFVVFRSNKNISAQIIDDVNGVTL